MSHLFDKKKAIHYKIQDTLISWEFFQESTELLSNFIHGYSKMDKNLEQGKFKFARRFQSSFEQKFKN